MIQKVKMTLTTYDGNTEPSGYPKSQEILDVTFPIEEVHKLKAILATILEPTFLHGDTGEKP